MNVKELNRRHNRDGQTVVEYEAGNLRMKLINSYDSYRTFEDLVFAIACRRLAERTGTRAVNAS